MAHSQIIFVSHQNQTFLEKIGCFKNMHTLVKDKLSQVDRMTIISCNISWYIHTHGVDKVLDDFILAGVPRVEIASRQ